MEKRYWSEMKKCLIFNIWGDARHDVHLNDGQLGRARTRCGREGVGRRVAGRRNRYVMVGMPQHYKSSGGELRGITQPVLFFGVLHQHHSNTPHCHTPPHTTDVDDDDTEGRVKEGFWRWDIKAKAFHVDYCNGDVGIVVIMSCQQGCTPSPP